MDIGLCRIGLSSFKKVRSQQSPCHFGKIADIWFALSEVVRFLRKYWGKCYFDYRSTWFDIDRLFSVVNAISRPFQLLYSWNGFNMESRGVDRLPLSSNGECSGMVETVYSWEFLAPSGLLWDLAVKMKNFDRLEKHPYLSLFHFLPVNQSITLPKYSAISSIIADKYWHADIDQTRIW